jgi:hypothetical protein
MAVFVVLLIMPAVSTAQTTDGEGAPQPSPQAPEDSSAAPPVRSLLLLPDRFCRTNTTLTFTMRPTESANKLMGFELYKASRLECAYRGAGMGMTVGMAAGAFGMMAGTWDERETWYIAGAMAALGTLYGGLFKADDPKWNLRIRIEPDR